MECSVPLEKEIAEGTNFLLFHPDLSHKTKLNAYYLIVWFWNIHLYAEEEEEIEMLLENYLQR